MPNVDQFESVFKGASKPVFAHESVRVDRVTLVTDLEPGAAEAGDMELAAKTVLKNAAPKADWTTIGGDSFHSVGDLLDAVEASNADIVVTYRNLKSINWKWHHTLGGYVDVLVSKTDVPVLLLPHPKEFPDQAVPPCEEVMALTDHLAGEERLVNWAVAATEPNGTLFLTHVEDDATFERMLDAISKIPAIDTDIAREEIKRQLLKEPADYIKSCQTVLANVNPSLKIEAIVTTGHRLHDHKRLVDEHGIDLVVMHSHEDDQLAMHGLSYPLAVELRQVPLMLL